VWLGLDTLLAAPPVLAGVIGQHSARSMVTFAATWALLRGGVVRYWDFANALVLAALFNGAHEARVVTDAKQVTPDPAACARRSHRLQQ